MNTLFRAFLYLLFLIPYSLSHASIDVIDVSFCNQTDRSLTLTDIAPDESFDVCVEVSNAGETSVEVQTSFVDAVSTSDGENIACKEEGDERHGLAAHIHPPSQMLSLEPDTTKTVTFQAQLPTEYAGINTTCFVYWVPAHETSDAIQVILRKARIIRAHITGDVITKIKLMPTMPHAISEPSLKHIDTTQEGISIYVNTETDELLSYVPVHNAGNTPIRVHLDIHIQDSKSHETQITREHILLPQEEKMLNNGPIPLKNPT